MYTKQISLVFIYTIIIMSVIIVCVFFYICVCYVVCIGQVGLGVGSWSSNRATEGSNVVVVCPFQPSSSLIQVLRV